MDADIGRIVEEHQSMVYSLALHFLRDPESAQELAQEVFLQLHQSMAAIDSPGHLKQWLRRVTANRCIDHARKMRIRPRVGLDDIGEPAAPGGSGDLLLSDLLGRMVSGLPERSRMIVILRYQEDLDPADIARILDIPIGTVKSQLHRSLALLREKLDRAGALR
jgi:RNA polymerase sigma-70 factor (ECF subfamily)